MCGVCFIFILLESSRFGMQGQHVLYVVTQMDFFFCYINVNIQYISCLIVYCCAKMGTENTMCIQFNFVFQHCIMRISFLL